MAELSASEGEWCNRERGWAPDHSKALASQQLVWTLSTPTSWYKGTAFYPLRSAKFSENINRTTWVDSILLCSWWQKGSSSLNHLFFCLCQAPHLPMWGATVNTSRVFWAAYYGCKLQLLLTELLVFTPILTLPFRMGLEALVESYAFWRPSLRTLTFEDIPGIPKQGKSQSVPGQGLPWWSSG